MCIRDRLGYCIHGDETEGSDAALAVAHHLLADRTPETAKPVSSTHLRAHETVLDIVCRLLLEKKNN